ncbi:MAG: epimerase [Pseudomonadota bacterium]
MTQSVLILGAGGRFGRHATTAFTQTGWEVRTPPRGPAGVDIFDPASVTQAARGVDVIVNALNPAYPDWARDVPRLTQSVITAAEATGALVIVPGNIYPYGAGMPPLLTSTTAHAPTTRKGQIRTDMEEAYRASNARCLILRAGDFLDVKDSGNWFESHIAKAAPKGRFAYPGPTDQPHAWAFLPDMARAAEALAAQAHTLPRFADVPFPGYTLTGEELRTAVEHVLGHPVRHTGFPWRMLRLMALVSPLMREVLEMRYLWNVPHQLDATPLQELLPTFKHTPLEGALRTSLSPHSSVTSTQTSRWSEAASRPSPSSS